MQETVEQYKKRMFDFMEGRDPLKLQAAAPARLAKLLRGVSPAKARKRPAPDKWSISEIVAHIADTELVGGYRIRAILGAAGNANHRLRSGRVGKGAALRQAQPEEFVRAVSRAAGSQPRAAEITESGTVEARRDAQRTRRRERRDDRANVLGPRHQPLRADRTHPGEKEEVAKPRKANRQPFGGQNRPPRGDDPDRIVTRCGSESRRGAPSSNRRRIRTLWRMSACSKGGRPRENESADAGPSWREGGRIRAGSWRPRCAAQPRKKRCSAVKPSMSGGAGFPASVFSNAAWEIVSPPRSAMLSPSSSLPFPCKPGSTS